VKRNHSRQIGSDQSGGQDQAGAGRARTVEQVLRARFSSGGSLTRCAEGGELRDALEHASDGADPLERAARLAAITERAAAAAAGG